MHIGGKAFNFLSFMIFQLFRYYLEKGQFQVVTFKHIVIRMIYTNRRS